MVEKYFEVNRSSSRYTVAELFCGCGGFSRGFLRSERFNVVLGNDIKDAALLTFRINNAGELGEPESISDDIREVSEDQILAKLRNKGIDVGELDCLIGGPPCQGFSQMRRSEEREGSEIVGFKGYDRLSEDPRNDLVLRFLEIAQVLKPRFIVIENVPQMLRHGFNGVLGGMADAVREMLDAMDYHVAVRVLNAADYGVPQLRERALFIASRDGYASFPNPTHVELPLFAEIESVSGWVTVKEAISDLPIPPLSKDKLGGGPLDLYPQVELSDFAQEMRGRRVFPYNHISRAYSRRVIRIIQEMCPGETWDSASARVREHYMEMIKIRARPGETQEETKQRLIKERLINPVFYKSYYWSAYTRLTWDRPALTITANANFLGSGRFTHPEQDRGITMREAARLQSFDDDFRFITSPNNPNDTERIGVGMDMIGEAVPPLLAKAIAKHIAGLLDQEQEIQTDFPEFQVVRLYEPASAVI